MAPAAPEPAAPAEVSADAKSPSYGHSFLAGLPDRSPILQHSEATKPRGPATVAPAQARGPGASPPGGAKPGAVQDETPVTPPASTHHESMLIYTATLVLAVYQVDQSLGKSEDLARGIGGYLASRTDVAITVRVPRDRFQELLGKIEKLGDVLHRTVQAEDVTDEVVDLEARLKNARAMRDRLATLLSGATATKDALEIERELSRVMGDIESIEGKLKLFADKVAYSTEVHAIARLPFPWLQELGLAPLLRVR